MLKKIDKLNHILQWILGEFEVKDKKMELKVGRCTLNSVVRSRRGRLLDQVVGGVRRENFLVYLVSFGMYNP